ncbi:hypothetical protein G2912_01100 [Paraburkholderia aspalathi]|uniref:Uncharacterized protein n=1 Tax=Paraburkholderia nemoris TaxID=2793076 RepID=A0ABM8QN35_9BURK|nr:MULTISPECIES: hypothetical protein [Paraburkholderia]MBK3808945.1 hypothetical protein [Paraburkholderia aspalathi]CAE6706123.1 hypothetical protein R69776_00874 [Paraburkholderia nemoris]
MTKVAKRVPLDQLLQWIKDTKFVVKDVKPVSPYATNLYLQGGPIVCIYRQLSDDGPNPHVRVVLAGKYSEELTNAFLSWAEQPIDAPLRNLITHSHHPREVKRSPEEW